MRAGVSKATVSLALRGHPRISETTRRRVQELAEQMGYRVHPLVATLMTQLRSTRKVPYQGVLAFLHTCGARHSMKQGAWYRRLLDGSRQRANALGYDLQEFDLFGQGLRPHQLPDVLRARGIHGVLVNHHPTPDLPGRQLPFSLDHFAVACTSTRLIDPDYHFVGCDAYQIIRLLVLELVRMGYRRIGLVTSYYTDYEYEYRHSGGYLTATQQYQVPVLPICCITSQSFQPVRTWYREHRPEVVIGMNDETPCELAALGLRLPEDVGWAHVDRSPSMAPWSGIDQNHEQIGWAAIDMLVAQIQRNERGVPAFPKLVMIEGRMVPGETLRAMTENPVELPRFVPLP